MEKIKDKVWHQLPTEEFVQFLGVNLSTGLCADEVQRRQKASGLHRVTARRGTPAWLKFLKQFNQPLVYILLLAVGVTAFPGEWVDASVIFGVVLINAIVGFLQEAKAEKAIEALARMVTTETTVRRDGRGQCQSAAATIVGVGLFAVGGRFGIAGVRALRRNLTPYPKPLEDSKLVQHGVYGLVRHPLYSSLMFASVGWALLWRSWPGLAAAGALTLLLHAKAWSACAKFGEAAPTLSAEFTAYET